MRVIFACKLLVLSLVLLGIGCSEKRSDFPPDFVIEHVDKVLAPQFVRGDWRYRGARPDKKAVLVYIQIPDRLDMPELQQVNYIELMLCPKQEDKAFWQGLEGFRMFFRTFNYVERNYVQTECQNPFI